MGSTNMRFLGWTHIDLATLGRKHGTRHKTSRRARCGGRVPARTGQVGAAHNTLLLATTRCTTPHTEAVAAHAPHARVPTINLRSITISPATNPQRDPPPKKDDEKRMYHVKRTPHFPRNKDALIFSSPWSQRTPSSPVHEADEIESCPRTQGRPANRCPPLLPGPFGHPIYRIDLDPGQFGAWSAGRSTIRVFSHLSPSLH